MTALLLHLRLEQHHAARGARDFKVLVVGVDVKTAVMAGRAGDGVEGH